MTLYRLTKVSTCWNEALNNYKSTAEKIKKVLHLNLESSIYGSFTLQLHSVTRSLALWLKTNFEIKYKTAIIPFNNFGIGCFMKFASSLERVRMERSQAGYDTGIVFDSNPKMDSVFPKLHMLSIKFTKMQILDILKDCTFPALQKLKMPSLEVNSYDEVSKINNFFSKMPEVYQLCMQDVLFSIDEFDEDTLEVPFRLKSLCLYEFFDNLIEQNAETLENLSLTVSVAYYQMEFIIQNMKKLKFLAMGSSYCGEYQERHDPDNDKDDDEDFVDFSCIANDDEDDDDYSPKKIKFLKPKLAMKNDTITTLMIADDLFEYIGYIPLLTSLETLIIHETLQLRQIMYIGK